MNGCLNGLLVVAVLAIVSPGCSDGDTNTEPKKPSETTGAEGKALSPKAKAELENAKKADPRSR